jgi:hypothetical protein
MKLVFFLLLISSFIFPQPESINKKLDGLFEKVDVLYNDYKNNNNSLTLNKSQAEDIIKPLFELYSFHWVETYNYIDKKYHDAEIEFKESGGKNYIKPLAVKLRIVKDAINNLLGKNYSEILVVPYYFKVKIIDIDKNGVYKSGDRSFGKTTITCNILDVVKGTSFFKKGEIIKVSVLTGWGVGPFEVGSEYFLPVKPWNCNDGNCIEFTLNLFDNSVGMCDSKYDIYPIKNNDIKNSSYFNLSSSNYDAFIKEFKNKYLFEVAK